MNKIERVDYFCELYNLLNVYSYKRDAPVDDETADFFVKIKKYCCLLDLDYEHFKREFDLLEAKDF